MVASVKIINPIALMIRTRKLMVSKVGPIIILVCLKRFGIHNIVYSHESIHHQFIYKHIWMTVYLILEHVSDLILMNNSSLNQNLFN